MEYQENMALPHAAHSRLRDWPSAEENVFLRRSSGNEKFMQSYARLPIRNFVAPEIVLGAGSLELAGQYACDLSQRRVLLVTDRGVREAGWADKVKRSLALRGLEVALFDQVTASPKSEEVILGARHYLDNDCDLIVAVGGGSPMDCAKAIGIVATNKVSILQFEGVEQITTPGPPIICIPTTAGSSADVSPFTIINDVARRRKVTILSKLLVPDFSLIDPLTTSTMSDAVTVSTGMDALCHALESYVSNASSPLTDLCALESARLISSSLPIVHNDPTDARARDMMMLGSLYAGLAFSNASLGLTHAMAHSLGGLYDCTHGEVNAVLLERVVRFNYPYARDKYDTLERVMFGDAGGKDSLFRRLRELREKLGIRRGLERFGLRREDIPYLGEVTLVDLSLATNPRPATQEDIEGLYEEAL